MLNELVKGDIKLLLAAWNNASSQIPRIQVSQVTAKVGNASGAFFLIAMAKLGCGSAIGNQQIPHFTHSCVTFRRGFAGSSSELSGSLKTRVSIISFD